MNRHLLPDEIDLLVDGEAGFGGAPLKAHVRGCAECAQLFDEFVTKPARRSLPPHEVAGDSDPVADIRPWPGYPTTAVRTSSPAARRRRASSPAVASTRLSLVSSSKTS